MLNTKPKLAPDILFGLIMLILLGLLNKHGLFAFRSMLPYALLMGYFTIKHGLLVGCIFSVPIAFVAIPTDFIATHSEETNRWELIWLFCKLVGLALGIHIGRKIGRSS